MRVYEFSKEHDISSKEVLQALQDVGFEVDSHMAVLTDEQVEYLNELFGQSEDQELDKKTSRKGKIVSKKQAKQSVHDEGDEVIFEKEPKRPEKKTLDTERKDSHFNKKENNKHEKKVKKPDILVLEPMSVADVADSIGHPVTDVIVVLLRWGIVATKNQVVSEDIVERLATHYEVPFERPKQVQQEDLSIFKDVQEGDLKERPPVVVVVGHVDHGKTTLLDYIRKTRVTAREKGGITQHLGAYAAHTPQGDIVFIDTPGHEAFSKMRVRGVRAADIAVLVVAADDSVMPQTIEALKATKEMGVPIIVAINKIDKVEPSRLETVKRDLAQHDLLPEEWGGQTVLAPISAKEGTGVDHLLDMIVLQSQLMELKADFTQAAKGYILESKLERGRGPVATLLCRHGKVKIGDYFVCGSTVGKVTAMFDSFGKAVKRADAKAPVQVVGFDDLPEAGSYFEVVPKNEYIAARSHLKDERKSKQFAFTGSSENVLTCIIKTDTDSSKEALLGSLQKLSKKIKYEFNVIHAGVGDVTESDAMLAANTGSSVIAFHAKAGAQAKDLMRKHNVRYYQFDIIYKLLEALEALVESSQEEELVRTKIGEAEVRKVFNVKNIGVIAGCYVKDGTFSRDGYVVGWRGRQKIGEGKIRSLQREKKTVKEVHVGYECGFIAQNMDDWQEGDRAECFIDKPVSKKKGA